MSVNIWLEEVPDAILELVKSRLLRRRKLTEQYQEDMKRKALEPGPQLEEFGADSRKWKRPEPGAVQSNQILVAHGPSLEETELNDFGAYQQMVANTLATKSSAGTPSEFSWKVWSGDQKQFIEHSETLNYNPGPVPGFTTEPYTFLGRDGEYWSAQVLVEAPRSRQCITLVLPAGKDKAIVIKVFRYSSYTLSENNSYNFFKYWETVIESIPNASPPAVRVIGIATAYGFFPNGTTPIYDPPRAVGGNSFQTPEVVSVDAFFLTTTAKAYLCTKKTIKEISIKPPLQLILDHMNPASTTPVPYQYLFGWPTVGIPNDVALPNLSDLSDGFYDRPRTTDPPIVKTWTPSIFAALYQYAADNDLALSLNPNDLRSIPANIKPLLTDAKGYYDNNLVDRSLYYAQWKGDRENVDPTQLDLYKSIPQSTLRIPEAQESLPEATTVHAVWDWNNPSYCRQMCRALGFTNADLRP